MEGIRSYIFNQKFEGKVWKILPNSNEKYLALEIREESKHQVSFFILDLHSHTWLWEGVTFEEQWWINLQKFHEDELQFIYYEDGSSPEQKQYLTINIHSKAVNEDSVEVNNKLSAKILSSVHYLESTDHFSTVSKFLLDKLNISPIKGVDYLEIRGVIIISYYIWKEDHLANFLLIIDQKGSIITHILLADELSSIGIDTFFVIGSSLFTVRQKSELLIYDL